MEEHDLTEEVVRFILDHIDTVPHLEALLLLRDSTPRAWTATEIATRLYVPVASVHKILLDLERRELVKVSADRYSFQPGDTLAGRVDAVANAYRTRLATVASLIHSRGSSALREFSRAFRLKNE